MKTGAVLGILGILSAAAISICAGGCVSQAQYDQVVRELEQSRKDAMGYKLELEHIRNPAPTDLVAASAPAGDLPPLSPTVARPPGPTSDVAQAASAPAVLIKGKITAVKRDMASIDIGSGSGLKAGDRLYVFPTKGERTSQPAKYAAILQVEFITADESAGLIVDKRINPVVGDQVRNTRE